MKSFLLAIVWLFFGTTVIDSYRFAAAGGPTFLINEGFEGTGAPASWSGSADFDSTTSPIVGAQSLRAEATEDTVVSITPEGTVYGKMRIRPVTLPTTFMDVLFVRDPAFDTIFKISLTSAGILIVESGGIYETTVAALSANTVYYLWFRFTVGTGANSIARIWFSTTDSKPADGSDNSAGNTNGTVTTNAQYFYYLSSGEITVDFDTVQLATTAF